MIFKLGDRFIVDGVKGTAQYVNAGMAWLYPDFGVDETFSFFRGERLLTGLAFAKVYKDGSLDDGTKVKKLKKKIK